MPHLNYTESCRISLSLSTEKDTEQQQLTKCLHLAACWVHGPALSWPSSPANSDVFSCRNHSGFNLQVQAHRPSSLRPPKKEQNEVVGTLSLAFSRQNFIPTHRDSQGCPSTSAMLKHTQGYVEPKVRKGKDGVRSDSGWTLTVSFVFFESSLSSAET